MRNILFFAIMLFVPFVTQAISKKENPIKVADGNKVIFSKSGDALYCPDPNIIGTIEEISKLNPINEIVLLPGIGFKVNFEDFERQVVIQSGAGCLLIAKLP